MCGILSLRASKLPGLLGRAEEEERAVPYRDSRLVACSTRDFRPGLSHSAATRLDWV